MSSARSRAELCGEPHRGWWRWIDPDAGRSPAPSQPLADPRYEIPLSGIYWQVDDVAAEQDGAVALAVGFRIDAGPARGPAMASSFVTDRRAGRPVALGADALDALQDRRPESGPSASPLAAGPRAYSNELISRFGNELAIALAVLGAGAGRRRLGCKCGSACGRSESCAATSRRSAMAPATRSQETYPSRSAAAGRRGQRAAGVAAAIDGFRPGPRLRPGAWAENAALRPGRRSRKGLRDKRRRRQCRSRRRDRPARWLTASTTSCGCRGCATARACTCCSASLNDVLARTVAVLRKTRDGEALQWHVDRRDGLDLDIDRHDLIELIGVLLENAAKWARTLVRVEARKTAVWPKSYRRGRPRASIRSTSTASACADAGSTRLAGHRPWPRNRPRDRALNDGSITFDNRRHGGLLVSVELPLADQPAPLGQSS